MSFSAPLVTSPKTISSEARPPMMPAICCFSSCLLTRYLSSSGRLRVQPRAMPRLMMLTLRTGSQSGSAFITRACPTSW